MLSLNYKHSKARYKTAVYLLNTLLDEHSIQTSFNRILQAAHMRRADYEIPQRGETSSYMMNNMSNLLSPNNIKKLEKKNLYDQ